MKLVYIAHPLSAPTPEGIAANLAEAKRWVAWVARLGLCPVATWIPLAEGLLEGGEENSAARALGLACDQVVLDACDAVLFCGSGMSEGMLLEEEWANQAYKLTAYAETRDSKTARRLQLLFAERDDIDEVPA